MAKTAGIISASLAALIAVAFAYVALGLCLAQLLEDVRPSLVPLVNIGAIAILCAVAIGTFRFVLRNLHGGRSAG